MSTENLENTPPNDNPAPQEAPTETEVDRLKKELAKQAKENKDFRAQLDNQKINALKEKEDWKGIAQTHEQKAAEYESKYTSLQSALVDEKKFSALKEEALKQGINPASVPDLELLDFEELLVETTSTGKILVSGADRAVAKLKTMRPHWFSKVVPGINSNSPVTLTANPNQVTLEMLNTAETNWKKTRSDSDRKAYENLIYRYKAQSRA